MSEETAGEARERADKAEVEISVIQERTELRQSTLDNLVERCSQSAHCCVRWKPIVGLKG